MNAPFSNGAYKTLPHLPAHRTWAFGQVRLAGFSCCPPMRQSIVVLVGACQRQAATAAPTRLDCAVQTKLSGHLNDLKFADLDTTQQTQEQLPEFDARKRQRP